LSQNQNVLGCAKFW